MKVKGNLTKGKPFITLLLFALPMVLSVTLQQLYNICDSFIAGRYIGDDALASISASYPITMVYLAIGTGFGIGANIVTARYIGEKNNKKAKETIFTSLITIGVIGLLLGIISFIISEGLIVLIKVDQNAKYFQDTVTYLQYYSLGILFLFIYNCVTSLFQALGNSRIPLYFLIFSTILNVILDYCFVRYLNLGVPGIALATFIAQALAAILSFICLIFYVRKLSLEEIKYFNINRLKSVLMVAIPSILQASAVSFGQILIQSLVNGYGQEVVAGYGAAYKMCYIIVNIYSTMSNAISTFTSQNAGAKEYKRIMKGYLSGLVLCGILTIVTTIIFVVNAEGVVSIMLNEESSHLVKEVGSKFIYCVAPFFILLCIKIPSEGVLKGSKDMRSSVIATSIDLCVRVVLAYVLSSKMGIVGVFISWPIGWFVGMSLAMIFFYSGRWKKLIGYKIDNKKII